MKPFESLKVGMGVGGWMTNYKRVRFLPADRMFEITAGDKEHFERYLTRWDVQNIKSMGMDHIRIPFDQCVIEDYDKPGEYREDMLKLIDRIIGWSLEEGLEVVLNLHHAFGCYCDFAGANFLMEREDAKQRLVDMWAMFEDRYHDNNIIFELLNEVTTSDSEAWNALAERCVKAIRAKNPTRRIIIGCAAGNSVNYLKTMQVYDDEYIGYTYHFYSPHTFTHQRTTISQQQYLYNREFPWPGDNSYYNDYDRFCGGDGHAFDKYPLVGKEYLYDMLQPVVDWKKAHPDKWLWFGEFGTIRHANIRWRENWMRDVVRHAVENGIPYCNWNYLSTPYDCNRFSLVTDDERKIVSEEMLRIIQGKVF